MAILNLISSKVFMRYNIFILLLSFNVIGANTMRPKFDRYKPLTNKECLTIKKIIKDLGGRKVKVSIDTFSDYSKASESLGEGCRVSSETSPAADLFTTKMKEIGYNLSQKEELYKVRIRAYLMGAKVCLAEWTSTKSFTVICSVKK